jgi:hypothetical protein
MFNDAEKEELKRIVDKFVKQGLCARPMQPEKVLEEVNHFKQTEGSGHDGESADAP